LFLPAVFGWQASIRVETSLVAIPVTVTDAKGKHVQRLRQDDFRLFQDEMPEAITYFAASEEPLRVALLLDTSKSTVPVLPRIRKGARSFLEQLRPQDQAMILAFDSEVHVRHRMTGDLALLRELVMEIKPGDGPGTHLRDALAEAVAALQPVTGRRAIALMTDGQDMGSSRITPAELASRLESAGVPVYPVYYRVDPREMMRALFGTAPGGAGKRPSEEWNQREKRAEAWLEQVAALSAGTFYRSDIAELDRTFARVAAELRNQYLLGFYPARSKLDGRPHALRVEVNRPGVQVRARRSYNAAR